jgi:hypothetical protein
MPKARIRKVSRVVFNPRRLSIVDPGYASGKVRRDGLYAHFCFDFEDTLIDETDDVFEACTCGMPNPKT